MGEDQSRHAVLVRMVPVQELTMVHPGVFHAVHADRMVLKLGLYSGPDCS
jgi:hypothetical protein